MHASCCHAARPSSFDAAAASRAAERAARPERSLRHRGHDEADSAPARHTERSHPLVAAMTEALRSLMPTNQPANQPVEPSRELKDSARAFAHELADALRGSGGHGHGLHGARRGYDDLAQRVERLAGEVSRPAAAIANTSSTTLSANLSTASIELSVEGDRTSASLSMTTIELQVSQQTGTAGTPETATESPLLAAFRRLMTALQPAESAAASGSADQLGSFLRRLASALRGGEAASEGPSGSLISLAA
ncbi:MAG: hypothetical protein AB7U92_14980 [Piscinibacter sp.]|uniref:hypothetical protein n=1 Tax=Piscinibacter sp. TaxID=1903157 RepID=UPI003D0FA83F